MAAAMDQEYILHLPQNIIELLRKVAADRKESTDEIAAEALRFALEPIRQDALHRLKSQVRRQRSLPELEIRANLEARITPAERRRLSRLLERNREGRLTTNEQAEMHGLFDRIEAVATKKAAAIRLLSGDTSDSDPPA